MKKRLFALLLTLVMVCGLMPAASAVSSDEAAKAAQALYDLGLFQGTGTNADGTPNFDLDRTPTRAEAVTMLVRLLGKDEEAKSGTWTTPFTDVDEWAKPYVGYAYANGLTTGTSATTFGGQDTIDASQYLTFVLRALGYESGKDFQWDKAWEKSDEIKLTNGNYNANAKSITRGDVAVISEKAIRTAQKGMTELLGASLNAPNFKYKPITVENLQGIWVNQDSSNNHMEEVIVTNGIATYMLYNGLETVYQSGPFVINDGGELRWTSSDYYLYAPTSSLGKDVIYDARDDASVRGLYEIEALSSDMILCSGGSVFTKAEHATLYDRCSALVKMANAKFTQNDKAIIAQNMQTLLEGQQTVGTAVQQALRADSMLITNSISGTLSYSEQKEVETIMTQDCKIVQDICWDAQTLIKEIISVCEGKDGGDACIEKMTKLSAMNKKASEWGTVTNHDELMDFAAEVSDLRDYTIEVSEWMLTNVMEKD